MRSRLQNYLLPLGKFSVGGASRCIHRLKASSATTTHSNRLRFSLLFDPAFQRPTLFSLHEPLMGQSRRLYHILPGATPRDMADLEDRVWAAVSTSVQDPEIGKTLKDLGWMNRRLSVSKNNDDGSSVFQLLLKLPTLLHPSLDQLKERVKEAALVEIKKFIADKKLDQICTEKYFVNVEAVANRPVPFTAGDTEDTKDTEARLGPGLVNVAHYVAVYSCKGGVGKSTVAVNLAYELARLGGRVGLLDLDVYGPSLPVLVRPDDPAVRRSPLGKGMVMPIEHKGVKLLSLGYVSAQSGVPGSGQNGGAAVLRGPMAGKVVTQLLKGTDWGDLDVLILDMPPGTGDVQLTLLQDLELSGAVGVTTPSQLAIADARKGIEMFFQLGVPTFAMVENMSYFECEGGKTHFPFGKGFQEFMDEVPIGNMNRNNVCKLPISSAANDANDEGIPLSLSRPETASRELDALSQLARIVSKELLTLPFRPENSSGQVSFDDNPETFELGNIQLNLDGDTFLLRVFSEKGAIQKRFSPNKLRGRDPRTGASLPDESAQDEPPMDKPKVGMVEIHRSGALKGENNKNIPERMEKKGKIGFQVTWSDGAKYIYSKRAIVLAAGGRVEQQKLNE